MDDYLLAAPENLFAGTVEALTNGPIIPRLTWSGPIPTDFTEGLADAQSYFSDAESSFSRRRDGVCRW